MAIFLSDEHWISNETDSQIAKVGASAAMGLALLVRGSEFVSAEHDPFRLVGVI